MERKELHLVYNEKTGSDMYDVAEADAVMDSYEGEVKHLEHIIDEQDERIKALKSANEYLENKNSELIEENYTMVARIKELEANQPKWTSVKDRLPKECDKDKFGYVLVMTSDGTCYTSEFDPEANDPYGTNEDYRWFTGYIYLNNVAYWRPLPKSPTTEISSVDAVVINNQGGEK